jgi:hypothetical protein
MKRSELIVQTRRLIDEGERLQLSPSLPALRVWLQLSDELLSAAWGQMDRYHLAWLMVGRPDNAVRGRKMTAFEEADYVREVAGQKTAALRLIDESCHSRTENVPVEMLGGIDANWLPTEVTHGGATVFVLPLDQIKRI